LGGLNPYIENDPYWAFYIMRHNFEKVTNAIVLKVMTRDVKGPVGIIFDISITGAPGPFLLDF
jgi:hypothetical protein